jgi:hypothetical protein
MPFSFSSFFAALATARDRRWGDGDLNLLPVDETAEPGFWFDYSDDDPGPEVIVTGEFRPLTSPGSRDEERDVRRTTA